MLTNEEITGWLCETWPSRLEELWRAADAIRRQNVGDEVQLRGLIEISNVCARTCAYCGINASHKGLVRYRMSDQEILECAAAAAGFGYGTVVLQAGEDPELTGERVARLVGALKARHDLAVTLSLGEREDEELLLWRKAGADRYLLRFETSDPELFRRIHPPGPKGGRDRIQMLQSLREMGYEIGSGVMIGIPGQSYESLAQDLCLFARLDLDMIGVGPFIPDPSTPLGAEAENLALSPERQVPADELMAYKVVALARLLCPQANIPGTTALATLNPAQGREFSLKRGANVLMPNMTPTQYRSLYAIYPAKVCIQETAEACHACMKSRIESIGRRPGHGPGNRKRSG